MPLYRPTVGDPLVLKGVAAAMTSCRTIGICAPVRVLLITSGLTAGLSFGAAAAAAAAGDSLLSPTPLILKDGRIANVSVHVVAFAEGGSALDLAIAQHLSSLTDEVATDCFLTAQVIGHVGSSEVAGNDTLNAHRLARARADAVQASLIAGGLPAKAIASVWDWQFMVREARATLWVFRLTPGEDCEGTPLDSAAGPLVAQSEPRAAPPQSPQGSSVGTAAVAAEAAQPKAPALSAGLAARPALAETAQPVPPPVAAVPAGPSPAPARVPSITQALPAVGRGEAQLPARAADAEPAEAGAAAARPAAAERAAARPTEDKPVEAKPAQTRPAAEVAAALPGPATAAAAQPQPAQRQAALDVKEERLVIVFPTNSSYFPPGTGSQLRSLLRTLAQDRRYEVVLESSISGSQKVVGAETVEEAAKYNQWLATRRLERVRDWLDQNAAGRGLEIKPEYHANDESRQVVVRIRPTG